MFANDTVVRNDQAFGPGFDTVSFNTAFRNHPADLVWDGSGVGVRFIGNACGTSLPPGFCH